MRLSRPALTSATCALALALSPAAQAQSPAKAEFSPYVGQSTPNRVYWGDTHHHSSYSFDAGFMTTLDPEMSYRHARGEEVVSTAGLRSKLSRPLDFLVVSDHAEYIGMPDMLRKEDPALMAIPVAKRWSERLKDGPAGAFEVGWAALNSIFGERLRLRMRPPK
jgi:hypothetical protein